MAEINFPGETVVEIPIGHCVKKNCYALDIGGSLFKLAYIRAEEHSDKGYLHLATFQISETEAVIKQLKTLFSGLVKPGEEIAATGFAAQRMKEQISDTLNIKIVNIWEMDLFQYSFKYFLKNFHERDTIEAKSSELLEDLKDLITGCNALGEARRRMKAGLKCKVWGDFDDDIQQDDAAYETLKEGNDGAALPCLLVAVGSGAVITKIDVDGNQSLVGVSSRCGKALLGMASLLIGTKTFEELIDLASVGDVGNVCGLGKHTNVDDEGIYSNLPENGVVFCFAQAEGKNKDDFRREDLAATLLWTICNDLAHVLFYACQANGVRDVYFTGSMTGHSQLVREYLEKAFTFTQHFNGQVYEIRSHFLKHGAYYGAIGALLMNMEGQLSPCIYPVTQTTQC